MNLGEEIIMETAQNNDPSGSVHWLERKHKKMLRVAFCADILSWTVLALYAISTMFYVIPTIRTLQAGEMPVNARPYIWLDIGINILITFFHGVFYALVLKGVSLGLKMLVETDLNYKIGRQKGNHV
jgi:hypothetical protein